MKNTLTKNYEVVHQIHQAMGDGDIAANLAGVDLKGASSVMVILSTGTFGGTSPTLDVSLHVSDSSDTGYIALKDGAGLGTAVAFAQETTGALTYVGWINCHLSQVKRYLRAHVAITGTSPTGEYSVTFVVFGRAFQPVSQTNTVAFTVNT